MGTIVRQSEVELDGQRVGYTLLRIPRRRHVHLVVADDGELQVRAPYRFSQAEAEDAIREADGRLGLVYSVGLNDWNGRQSVELRVQHIVPGGASA